MKELGKVKYKVEDKVFYLYDKEKLDADSPFLEQKFNPFTGAVFSSDEEAENVAIQLIEKSYS